MSSTRSVLPYHDQRFDFAIERASEFVERDLDLRHAHALGRSAIIDEKEQSHVAAQLGMSNWRVGGGYNPKTKEAIVVANPDNANPVGASQRLVSKTVHEFVHSATMNPDELPEHSFWEEALAGIGEVAYLKELERNGKRRRVGDFVLHHGDTDLWVPGAFRYYENHDSTRANASQGLIAASAFAVTQQLSGIKGQDVLTASKPGARSHYDTIKESFEALKPGLSREINASFPQTTTGIIDATAMVHDEGRRQGIIPPLRR
jgi:hypothetical protein